MRSNSTQQEITDANAKHLNVRVSLVTADANITKLHLKQILDDKHKQKKNTQMSKNHKTTNNGNLSCHRPVGYDNI